MKKLFIPCLMAAALLSSCSNDEIVEQRQAAEITYAPAVAKATRGVTTTDNITEFIVDGYHNTDTKSDLYISGNAFKKVENAWTSNGTYFWPYSGSIDFYAYSPIELKNKVSYSEVDGVRTAVLQDYEVDTNNSDYKDPVYAVVKDMSLESAGGNPVTLDFKHILSQIVFNVKNTNELLVVDVHDISIANLASKGTYTLPNATTTLKGGPEGTWVLADKVGIGKTYSAYISGVEGITPESGVVSFATPEHGSMFLLPQTATAWDPKADPENEAFGSYILVNCRVWAMIAGEKTLLWPKTTNTAGEIIYRQVAIPVNIAWEQGKRYTYTLVFGEGAGYIPPTDTEPGQNVDISNKGDEVLKIISYDVRVDDYTEVGNHDIESVK